MARLSIAAALLTASTLTTTTQAAHITDYTTVWWPDWDGRTDTCLNGNTATPPTLFKLQEGYFESTKDACCDRYYGWRAADCKGGVATTLTGTNKFYPTWGTDEHRCARDCATSSGNAACGGILGSGTGQSTYDTATECCNARYSWLEKDYCIAVSNGQVWTGTQKFYLDSTENICVQDCDGSAPCGGIIEQSWVGLYDTIELCCSNALSSLDPTYCAAQSNPSVTNTNKWFVEGSICKKDCAGTGDECASPSSWDKLYDNAEACCQGKLSWVQEDFCKTRSDPTTYGNAQGAYTDKWYVDYDDHACKKDCGTSDPACKQLESSTQLYASAADCCSAKLGWIDSSTCATISTTGAAIATSTGTSKWYADYANTKRCVLDCAASSTSPNCGGVVANTAGVSLYDNAKECCNQKFGWYDEDLCEKLSENGGDEAASSTGKWYVKVYADEACVQDCAEAANAATCGGLPSSWGEVMFATAEACCTSKLGWVDKDSCKTKSENGVNAPATGSSKWYANYNDKKCAKDCAVATANPECAGILDSTEGKPMFDTLEACCKDRFGYVDVNLCTAMSNGSGHTNKFYPDQGAGICHQDCTGAAPCNGSPTDLSVPLYDTAEACCKSSVGWAKAEVCQQLPVATQGTNEWYVDWSKNKCVKNCDTSVGGSCGGLAESYNQLYSSASLCCSQSSAMSWMEESDCIYT